jgi:hypothetical protein
LTLSLQNPTVALQTISLLLPFRRKDLYTRWMPSSVHIQLRKVAQPRVIPHGFTVEVIKEYFDLVVKDASGKVVGSFRKQEVAGWWVEGIPLDLSRLTPEDIACMMRDLEQVAGVTRGDNHESGGDPC